MAYAIVVMGTSFGGFLALQKVLENLSTGFTLPIAIVQHRHKGSDQLLSILLQQYSTLPIREVEDKDEILPGHVYLAPADYHLLVERGYFSLSTDLPVSYARPSIDVLFESAADAYTSQVIGVILTGANSDGAQGLASIKARGGFTIVQEPATAECQIMPKAAIASVAIDQILPLSEIASGLVNLCQSAPF